MTQVDHPDTLDTPRRVVHEVQGSWPSWLGRAIFESALIAFSVLLALMVDNWRETRTSRARFAEARAAIVAELDSNYRLLVSAPYQPHHRRLHDVYELMERENRSDEAYAIFKGGVHIPPLNDDAWRIFMTSDVAGQLPFAERAMLSRLYGQQAELEGMLQRLIASLTQPTVDRQNPAYAADLVHVIDLTLTDVVYLEADMVKRYEAALGALRR